jgi:pimeloyl-ACP methyl ester carboxylesterase
MQDIYVNDKGKGIPLVLVHGFLGSSIMWNPQIDFFKNYFRVITPDLPGFGKSNKVKSHSSIHSLSNFLIKHLEKKKIDKFYLLGHSMGGMVVQEMAKIIGNKILKLICYSTGPFGEMPERFETIEETRNQLKKIGLEATAKSITKTWFVLGKKGEYFDICIQSGKQASIESADNALIAMKKYNGVKNLNLIKNKTLIIWGDKDKSYNLKQVETLKKNILSSSLTIFKGCAHNVHLEKIKEFNETVLNFINS